MNDILEMVENGHWTDAIMAYKMLTVSPQQFREFIKDLPDNLVADMALLGYYAKEQR